MKRVRKSLNRFPTLPQVEEDSDSEQLFGVQHLTSADITQLEEALNTMDLEEMVATVDAIVGRYHALRKKDI
jgi:hypothetical protein